MRIPSKYRVFIDHRTLIFHVFSSVFRGRRIRRMQANDMLVLKKNIIFQVIQICFYLQVFISIFAIILFLVVYAVIRTFFYFFLRHTCILLIKLELKICIKRCVRPISTSDADPACSHGSRAHQYGFR